MFLYIFNFIILRSLDALRWRRSSSSAENNNGVNKSQVENNGTNRKKKKTREKKYLRECKSVRGSSYTSQQMKWSNRYQREQRNVTMCCRTFWPVFLISVWLSIWSIDAVIVTSDLDECPPRLTPFTMPVENRQFFPSPKNDSDRDLIFGVLLPEQPEKFGPSCAMGATLAAIELAIKSSQRPGGLLEDYSITVSYIDTETSSTIAAFAAFQLYTKRPPGYYTSFTTFEHTHTHTHNRVPAGTIQYVQFVWNQYENRKKTKNDNKHKQTNLVRSFRRYILWSVSRLFIGACHPICWCLGYTGDNIRWFCRSIYL